MKAILFLCHRLPYPPDKGDKIRAFNILQALRSRYRVHLGTFVDSPEDWNYIETLKPLVASLCVRPLPRRRAMFRSLAGLVAGEALTLPFYRDTVLQHWVNEAAAQHELQGALVFSSGMGQYLTGIDLPVKVMDFCDLDSDKWAQYAMAKAWPWSWIYRREARLLAVTERQLAEGYDHSLFVSELESDLFRSNHADLKQKVITLGNGVDTAYFDPARSSSLAESSGPLLVFTGAMDYWANVDAVRWFVAECWHSVREHHPEATFCIVGSNPTVEVQQLSGTVGVQVTGRVPDVRPWLAAASVVVAPLRIARGVQNKVLEAMAMAKPVVATSAALQGLGSSQGPEVHRANTAAEFVHSLNVLLARAPDIDATGNRQFVVERFGWEAALRPLWPLLERAA